MKKRNNIVRIRFLSDFLLLYGLVALCYSPVFFNGFWIHGMTNGW